MEVDWWTIGTLLYEMLAGLPPFYDEDTQEMYQKIIHMPLTFTEEIKPTARTLIAGLLQRDPEKRLGRKGVHEIKNHPFFAELNWEDLQAKRIKPAWKPKLSGALDTSNFDAEFTALAIDETMKRDPGALKTASDSVQKHFVGFTYVGSADIAK